MENKFELGQSVFIISEFYGQQGMGGIIQQILNDATEETAYLISNFWYAESDFILTDKN